MVQCPSLLHGLRTPWFEAVTICSRNVTNSKELTDECAGEIPFIIGHFYQDSVYLKRINTTIQRKYVPNSFHLLR